jgi:CHAT domain-containing protein/tetratricopeptide (TPR) repeat protein
LSVQQLALRRKRAMLDLDDGLYLDAERTLTDLIAVLRASGEAGAEYELGRALLDRATVRRVLNRWDDSLTDVDECERLVATLPPFVASSLMQNVYSLRAQLRLTERSPTYDPVEARSALDALVAAGSSAWWVREARANLAFRDGEWQRVADDYAEVANALRREGWARGAAAAELRRGTALLELGRFSEAGPPLLHAAEFFAERGPSDLRADAERQRARLLAAEGRADEAWAHVTTALSLVETSFRTFRSLFDQQRFLADKAAYYQHAFRVGLAAGGADAVWRALSVAERAKSFYLCQLMANADVPLFDGVDPADVEWLRALEDRLDELQAQMVGDAGRQELDEARSQVATERDELFARIMRDHPRWASARTPLVFDPARDLRGLPPGWSALSLFWLDDRELHLFLVQDGEPPFHCSALWSDDDLERLRTAQATLRTASARDLYFLEHVVPEALGTRIIPAEMLRRIPAGNHLLLSPHGALRGVPLHMIAENGERPLLGRAVQYIPTFALLGLAPTPAAPPAVLLLGCEQDGFQSPPLRSVPKELEAVESEWLKPPGTPVDRILLDPDGRLGSDAPPASDWSRYGIVHLACHGDFQGEQPLDAALRLGKTALRMSELFAVRLEADLVCLSACDLGQLGERVAGVQEAGDEWLGFTMPLLYAGARSIVVSLWKADDATASRLMPALHAAIRDGHEPAEALRDALASVADDPEAFWGNWYLVGFPADLTQRRKEMAA